MVLVGILAARPLAAQVVRGQVVDSVTGTPVASGFVVLLDEAGREVGRTLSSRQGRFTLRAPRPGAYRLRSERIGYRVSMSAPFELEAQRSLEFTLEVAALPVQLETIEVQATQTCAIRPEEGLNTAVVWEEVRKALAAAAWTASRRIYRFRNNSYQRDVDADLRHVRQEASSIVAGTSTMPFRSLSAGELAANGYIVDREDGIWYYAPDADVLQDETFLETHCFQVVRGGEEHRGEIGLGFEPIPERNLPDINGTLWLDEESSELLSLDFHYTVVPHALSDPRIGGTLEFMQVPAGGWIVHRWQIRMPALAEKHIRDVFGEREESELRGFRETGSEVLEITTLDGTPLYVANMANLAGSIFDSTRTTPAPLPNAEVRLVGTEHHALTDPTGRFLLTAPLDGEYQVTFRHPRLDSLGFVAPPHSVNLERGRSATITLGAPPVEGILARHCGVAAIWRGRRVLVGFVRDEGHVVAGAQVIASWQSVSARGIELEGAIARDREATVMTDSTGFYAVCGLPAGQTIAVWATDESVAGERREIIFGDREVTVDGQAHAVRHPVFRVDLGTSAVTDALALTAVAGVVTDAATGDPVPHARVSIAGTSLVTLTNTAGQFRLTGVTSGSHRIVVSRPGYQLFEYDVVALDTTREIAIPAGEIRLTRR